MRDLPMTEPVWITLLRAETEKPGKTIQAVADEIGMPRSSLSLLLSGNYPARLQKKEENFGPLVLRLYSQDVFCPHVTALISRPECEAHHTAPRDPHIAAKLLQWGACQRCPNNPKNQNTGDTPNGA